MLPVGDRSRRGDFHPESVPMEGEGRVREKRGSKYCTSKELLKIRQVTT